MGLIHAKEGRETRESRQDAAKAQRRAVREEKKRLQDEVEESRAVQRTERLNKLRARGRSLKARRGIARDRTHALRQAAAARTLASLNNGSPEQMS